ncbi:hypothetical protein ROHU_016034 [Labeo rohita]|uniref:Uncharacterized protein n=1 Tax=Labeo rohita TaxID=84645 RepID=A0A498NLH0_LABRO|nr:hypothetical protein ROHU_016034 [Labeo rohita]
MDGNSSSGLRAAGSESPVPCISLRTAADSSLLANGADSSTPSRTATTPPRPRSTAASLLSHLFYHHSSTTASGSHSRLFLHAARPPQHRKPTQQQGLL